MQCFGKNASGTACRLNAMEDGFGYCRIHHPKTEEEAQKAAVEWRTRLILQNEIEEKNRQYLLSKKMEREIEAKEIENERASIELQKEKLDFDVSNFEAEAIRILKEAASMDFRKDAEAIRAACELAQQIRLVAIWRNGDHVKSKKV